MWSGNVTLTDVRLRREACYALGLPVNIKLGCVKSVQVTIPWSKLGSEPVTIQLDGVYLVAGPLAESDWDESAQREWAWARKEGRLNRLAQAAEMSSLQAAAIAAAEERGAEEDESAAEVAVGGTPGSRGSSPRKGYLSARGSRGDAVSLLVKVLHNLQVSFHSLHVRYEDATNSADSPFAIGLTLKQLSAFTTDAAGNRKFCVDTNVQHKWLELQHLALYHHVHCAERMGENTSLDELTSWLNGMVERAHGQYVVSPMNIGARVAMRPSGPALAAGEPRTKVDVQLSAVSLSLCEQQLMDASRLVEYFMNAAGPQGPTAVGAAAAVTTAVGLTALAGAASPGVAFPLSPYGPLPLSSKAGAAGRWQYAIARVLQERRRLSGWRLGKGFFEARRAARLRYTELWKRSQGKAWLAELAEDEAAELRTMERDQLEVEDILQFRALARVGLMAEEEAHRSAQDAVYAPHARKTWWEWATGNSAASDEVPSSLDLGGNIQLSDEQRNKLAALLSGGAEAAAAPLTESVSAEYVEHTLHLGLEQLSLTLTADPEAHTTSAP